MLAARRMVLDEARSSRDDRGVSTPAFLRRANHVVLSRRSQEAVQARLQTAWVETEGAEYAKKAALPRPSRAGSASTPAQPAEPPEPPSDARVARNVKSYWKTHAFNRYGGLLWLKHLIATGDVDEDIVDAVNELMVRRTEDRRGPGRPSDVPDATPGNIFLSREGRASTPVPDGFVPTRSRRQMASAKMDGAKDEEARQAAMQELVAAEEDSKKTGFSFKDHKGEWHNQSDSTRLGLFEMSLQVVLRGRGYSEQEVDDLTRKPKEEGKGKGQGKGKGKGGRGRQRGGGR